MGLTNEFEKTIGSQSLVTAALSLSVTPAYQRDTFLLGVFLNASVNITETVTITRVSSDGSTYNVILSTTSLTAQKNVSYVPSFPVPIKQGDSILVECTKANSTGIVYATVILGGR